MYVYLGLLWAPPRMPVVDEGLVYRDPLLNVIVVVIAIGGHTFFPYTEVSGFPAAYSRLFWGLLKLPYTAAVSI